MSDDVIEKVKETGQEALEHGKQVAQDAAQSAQETVKESGQEHAQQVKESAQQSAQEATPRRPSRPTRRTDGGHDHAPDARVEQPAHAARTGRTPARARAASRAAGGAARTQGLRRRRQPEPTGYQEGA